MNTPKVTETRINPGDQNVSRAYDKKQGFAYINAHAPSLAEGKRRINRICRSERALRR